MFAPARCSPGLHYNEAYPDDSRPIEYKELVSRSGGKVADPVMVLTGDESIGTGAIDKWHRIEKGRALVFEISRNLR